MTSHHSEHVARLDVDFPNLVECLKANGPMTQKVIANAMGLAGPLAVPRALRAGVPEEGDWNLARVDASQESAPATPTWWMFQWKAQVQGNRYQSRGR